MELMRDSEARRAVAQIIDRFTDMLDVGEYQLVELKIRDTATGRGTLREIGILNLSGLQKLETVLFR